MFEAPTQVENAPGETGMDRQVVGQTGEVEVLVSAQEELAVDVEVGEVAGGQAGDVWEVVHLHPASPPSPGQNYISDQMFSFLKRFWKASKIRDAYLS